MWTGYQLQKGRGAVGPNSFRLSEQLRSTLRLCVESRDTEDIMGDFSEALWHGTRRYLMSNRTAPTPAQYVDALEQAFMTTEERDILIGRVNGWPGGNSTIKNATVADIKSAKAVTF